MLLRASEVAKQWQCSVRTVNRLVDNGKLAAIQLGKSARSRRFAQEDVDQCVRTLGEQCQSGNAAMAGKWTYRRTDDVLDALLAPKRSRSKQKEKSAMTSSGSTLASGRVVPLPTRSQNG